MTDLAQQNQQLLRQLVTQLDRRLQAPTELSTRQSQHATRLLLAWFEQVDAPDAALQALRARHAAGDDTGHATQQAELRAALSPHLGEHFFQGRHFDSAQDMLHAALTHEHRRQQQAQAKRDARRAARKAARRPGTGNPAAEPPAPNGRDALRAVYRQLASALHPDRETDPNLRTRKTELMSAVNTAYARQDLSVLLRLQLESARVDARKAGALSPAHLQAWCGPLERQLAALQAEHRQLRAHMAATWGYATDGPFVAGDLQALQHAARDALAQQVAQRQADLQQLQDDTAFKSWLKVQATAQKAEARAAAAEPQDVLAAAMRRMHGR